MFSVGIHSVSIVKNKYLRKEELKTWLFQISDLQIPKGINILSDKEEVIAQVTPPRSEEELEAMEEEAAVDQEKAGIENIEARAEAEKAQKAEGKEETEGETTSEAVDKVSKEKTANE